MSKYDGLNVKVVESVVMPTSSKQKAKIKTANVQSRPILRRRKRKIIAACGALIIGMLALCKFTPQLNDVFGLVKSAAAPGGSEQSLTDNLALFKEHIISVFAPGGRIVPSKDFNLIMPVDGAKEIRSDNRRIIIEAEDGGQIVRAMTAGKIKKVTFNSLGRGIILDLQNGFEIHYDNLSVCAVTAGQLVAAGHPIGSVNKDLAIELYYKGKKASLNYFNGSITYSL